ncbi:MAG: hypothetical protein JO147_06670, partial [Actinobacteria bacterium]|nr:hypothetical protein [Actinomycetota bacterium]
MAMFGRAAEDGTTFGRAAEDGGFVDPNALPPADEWPDEASYVPPPPFVRPPPTPPLPPIAPPGYYPPEAGYRSPPGTFGPSGRLGGDTPGYQYAIPPTYGYATLPTYGYATPPTYGYATPSNWSQLPGGTLLPARPSRLGQRGKRTLIVAGVLVFALIAGGLIADATLRSHHGIRLPAAFAGYSRLTNGTAKQLEDEMRSSISLSGQGSAQDAINGIYAHTGSDEPTL